MIVLQLRYIHDKHVRVKHSVLTVEDGEVREALKVRPLLPAPTDEMIIADFMANTGKYGVSDIEDTKTDPNYYGRLLAEMPYPSFVPYEVRGEKDGQLLGVLNIPQTQWDVNYQLAKEGKPQRLKDLYRGALTLENGLKAENLWPYLPVRLVKKEKA